MAPFSIEGASSKSGAVHSAEFKTSVGATSNFNVASGKAAKKSDDVAKAVRDTAGAIGYVDYSYASDHGLQSAQMKNQWGKFVSAGGESIQLAMRAADWVKLLIDQDPTFEMDLTNAGCPQCWPIASATYILVPLKGRNGNSVRVLEFFEHALLQGDEAAIKKGYVPLPGRAKNMISVAIRRWYASLDKDGAGRSPRRTQDEQRPTVVAAL